MTAVETKGETLDSPFSLPFGLYALDFFQSLPSTNDYLLGRAAQINASHPYYERNIACIAQEQTAGKGRRGRIWVSPTKNLYLSLLWHFSKPHSKLYGLSMAVATAVTQTLQKLMQSLNINPLELQLKWPNDILWNHQKLCGILIELIQKSDNPNTTQAVIGIGLNIQLVTSAPNTINQPYTDLQTILHTIPDSVLLTNSVLQHLTETLFKFNEEGLTPFIDTWHALDLTLGQPVTLSTPTTRIQGIGRGIHSEGQFLLEMNSGKILSFMDGEISLRLEHKDE